MVSAYKGGSRGSNRCCVSHAYLNLGQRQRCIGYLFGIVVGVFELARRLPEGLDEGHHCQGTLASRRSAN